MIPFQEGPAMVPEAAFGILQIFHMNHELILGFIPVILPIQYSSHICQKKYGHHQGIIPKLLLIDIIRSHMLYPALPGSGHLVHNPFRRLLAGLHINLTLQVLRQIGHGQIRGHGIHIALRKAYLLLSVIVPGEYFQIFLFSGSSKQFPDTVKPYSLSPFPVRIFLQFFLRKIFLPAHLLHEYIVILVQDPCKGSYQQPELSVYLL